MGILVIMSNHSQTRQSAQRKSDCFFYVDVRGEIAYVSERCCKYLGYAREAMISRAVADLELLDDHGKFMDMVGRRMRGQPSKFEAVIKRNDGATLPVEINITHAPYGNRMLLKCELREVAKHPVDYVPPGGRGNRYAVAGR